MYKCNDCGLIFDDDEMYVVKEKHREVDNMDVEYFYHCPNCGSGDFEEAAMCDKCGEWHSNDGPLCDDCKGDFMYSLEQLAKEFNLGEWDFGDLLQEYIEK